MIELLKTVFENKPKVLILGFGKEGRSSYSTIRKYFPTRQLAIADKVAEIENDGLLNGDTNIDFYVGEKYPESFKEFDLIIKSPGVYISDIETDVKNKITSQTDLFLQYYAKQVIGVTGTKGKSTTVSLIKHFLDIDNKDSILLGNIGVPAFDMIDAITENTVIVYELSAHQLEYIHRSPHISVLLNIFPEHLDYFKTLENYTIAKKNLYKYQSYDDKLIVSNKLINSDRDSSKNIIRVDMNNRRYEIQNTTLAGKHNLINIECALLAVSEVGVDIEKAIDSLDSFMGLPHRLEFIGEFGGVSFINDSISTVPESAIAAVKAIDNVDILILGGFDRGLDYSELAEFLGESDVSNFIFLGDAGERMFNLMNQNNSGGLFKAKSIEDVFDIIKKNIPSAKVCLLSPAAASYDMFKNFEHRGDKFSFLARSFE